MTWLLPKYMLFGMANDELDDREAPGSGAPAQSLTLFPLPPPTALRRRPVGPDPRRGARLREAERSQIVWGRLDLDAMLPENHPARAIWLLMERLDLSPLYARIEARDDSPGASVIDPRILLALWVYATSEGEGSAREIWRLTSLHAGYRWLCGGVAVGYHTLSDFRSDSAAVINGLITQVLALLLRGHLVEITRVAQDGTRVRARAGASSFRREPTPAKARQLRPR